MLKEKLKSFSSPLCQRHFCNDIQSSESISSVAIPIAALIRPLKSARSATAMRYALSFTKPQRVKSNG